LRVLTQSKGVQKAQSHDLVANQRRIYQTRFRLAGVNPDIYIYMYGIEFFFFFFGLTLNPIVVCSREAVGWAGETVGRLRRMLRCERRERSSERGGRGVSNVGISANFSFLPLALLGVSLSPHRTSEHSDLGALPAGARGRGRGRFEFLYL